MASVQDCPTCGGSGWEPGKVRASSVSRSGSEVEASRECRQCGGLGTIPLDG